MDTEFMSQDEGRIDPISKADYAREYVEGISNFAQREEEASEMQEALAAPEDIEPDLSDVAELAFGETLAYADEAPDITDEDVAELVAPREAHAEIPTAADYEPFVGTFPTTKDTNPKDGIGSLKPSYAAVPVPVLYEIGAALTEGARKYGGYNWRIAGVRTSVYIDAARRHLDDFWEGQDIDPDSGLSHITKAIASLVVFRDAQIQNMVANDDRPPSSVPFMEEGAVRVAAIVKRYPDPVHNFTQAEIAHMRKTPVNIFAGNTLGYEIEVMLPADVSDNGYIWTQQGGRRTSLDQSLAVVQALRDDGYAFRVIRITRVSDRIEEMQDGNQYVSGELRAAVTTVFPGDASLMEANEEDVQDIALADRAMAEDDGTRIPLEDAKKELNARIEGMSTMSDIEASAEEN